jgi:hypothetical protein
MRASHIGHGAGCYDVGAWGAALMRWGCGGLHVGSFGIPASGAGSWAGAGAAVHRGQACSPVRIFACVCMLARWGVWTRWRVGAFGVAAR